MSNLHVLFALRNEQAFSRTLDASRIQVSSQPPLSSPPRSWTRSHVPAIDVNARDCLGRTVLHLACATPESFAVSYVRLLLAHPAIDVNVQDTESHWTALHRGLYAGNLPAVIMLLQRSDTDVELRDYDGYTPFDLYNSTVYGTSLDDQDVDDMSGDLFTWGTNRNAALGHGDASDRSYPDQVYIQPSTSPVVKSPTRFMPIRVTDISMAKLHTAVITDESHGNLHVCGFGSGGRLGSGQHTQYSLQPVPQLTSCITAVALGQDHTIALTATGEVLSWGLNRFSQLGYMLEGEESIQTVARRVLGLLRKESVIGVAACRMASACWTNSDVFTWGTNCGQLGYDHISQPVQVLPRKVTGVQGVVEIALTDSAMVCLLETMDVVCFRADARFRIRFPPPDPASLPPYLHPYVFKPAITKITSTDGIFAALSLRGDIFTFATPPPPSETDPRPVVKPQRAWSLQKPFDPAKDLALGADGTLIFCTASGHVFIRARPGAKQVRIPYLHRVVRVCANSTGALAALRRIPMPRPVPVAGATFGEDMRTVRPWITCVDGDVGFVPIPSMADGEEDDEDCASLAADVATTTRLCSLLTTGVPSGRYGADILIHAGLAIPAHRAVLAARSQTLHMFFEGSIEALHNGGVELTYSSEDGAHLTVSGCQPMAVLLLLEYIYTDDFPAIWDSRVGATCDDVLARAGVVPAVAKNQLQSLARALELHALSESLTTPMKRVPAATLVRDMSQLFREPVSPPDVMLELAEREVQCHAVVLRARSQFFRDFFDDKDWTSRRWPTGGVIVVNMKHMQWRAVGFVMAWMCCGQEEGLFECLEDVDSLSDFLDLVFSVMAVASELLLDKLMLLCSSIILHHVTLQNVSSLLADATYYNALELVDSLKGYIVSNMEAMLASHLLDNVHPSLINDLGASVRKQQMDKAPVTRMDLIGKDLLQKHSAWLELQDIPQPLLRSQRPPRESPKLSPTGTNKTAATRHPPPPTPMMSLSTVTALATTNSSAQTSYRDEIFPMEDDTVPALNIGQPQSSLLSEYPLPTQAWMSKSAHNHERVDMKVIMAEAKTEKGVASGTFSGTQAIVVDSTEQIQKRSQKPSQRERRKLRAQALEEPMERNVSALSGSLGPANQRTVAQASSASASLISRRQPATPASVLQELSSSTASVKSPAVQRRSFSDLPAWMTPDQDASPTVSTLSFMAIQQQQRDQQQQLQGKRSIREIQQEEQARREEEEFLRWWAKEEQKLKVESEARTIAVKEGTSSQRGRGGPRGRGRGRGRGGDGFVRGRGNHPIRH